MAVLDFQQNLNALPWLTPSSSSSPSSTSGLRMSSRVLRTRSLLLLTLLLVLVLYWSFFAGSSSDNVATHTVSTLPDRVPVPKLSPFDSASPALTSNWEFRASRDRNDHSLTHDQCDHAFPKLYHEIRRAEEYWKKRQGNTKISPDQISLDWSPDGGLRAMIYNNQLYIVGSRGLNHFGHWMERSQGTLHQIHRAVLAAREPIPNIEFTIKINDKYDFTENYPKTENSTLWVFSRDIEDAITEAVWIIPDFNFWSYPRVSGAFGDFQHQAVENGDKFESKIDKLVWRGTLTFNPGIREALLQQTQGKTWSAVHKVVEDSTDPDDVQHKITMPDHCKYKFAVHTEGTTWSGRLKYLLSCHSVIFIHPLRYFTHLYHLLEASGPQQNYVATELDWSDLPAQMENLLKNPKQAKMIADNAASTFRDRYGTPAAQSCYFRELFRTWSNIAFEPDPWEYTTLKDGTKQKHWKGMTYEEYIFIKTDYPVSDEKKG